MTDLNLLIVEVTGIVASGVIGPAFTTVWVRRAERLRLVSEEQERRRGELQELIDEAAATLGEAALNVREEPAALQSWTNRFYVFEQRLLLRLAPGDPVVTSLEHLIDILREVGDEGGRPELLARFDAAQRTFLEEARTALKKRDFTPVI
jgi:hypothetical protein